MTTRREFIIGSSVAAIGIFTSRHALSESFYDAMARIEKTVEGRLGVTLFEARTNEQLAYRAEERFPLCSTFKLLATAAVLARVDTGLERLERRMIFGRE